MGSRQHVRSTLIKGVLSTIRLFSKLQLAIADKSVVLCSHRSDAQVVERVLKRKGVTLRAVLQTAYLG
eukprot:8285456-Pyramimonas_sp.AAC.1